MEAEELTPSSFGFFERLSMVPGIQIGRITSDRDTWVTSVQWQDVEATVLCSTKIGPATFDSTGKPAFGSYLIVDDEYGDHIKGQSDDDCVSYVRSWVSVRTLPRNSLSAALEAQADSNLHGPGLEDVSPVLGDPLRLLLRWGCLDRSKLKVLDGAEVSIEYADVAVNLGIESRQPCVIVYGTSQQLLVHGASPSAQASSILGYLDGLSDLTDE